MVLYFRLYVINEISSISSEMQYSKMAFADRRK